MVIPVRICPQIRTTIQRAVFLTRSREQNRTVLARPEYRSEYSALRHRIFFTLLYFRVRDSLLATEHWSQCHAELQY